MTSAVADTSLLVRRSINRTLRQPANLVFSFMFPMLLLAVNSGGLNSATKIPNFPANSYLTFALAVPFVQGALFASNSAGTNIAVDIETGFMSRLALTPISRRALLAGQLAGVVALGLAQAIVYFAVGEAAGAGFEAGVGGIFVLFALSVTVTLAFGSLGALAALRTGSGEAVQGLFPLFFVCLFLSSMALPRNLIEQDWFRTIASWNPVSYILEAIRSLLITGWDGAALAKGFGAAGGIALIGIALSARAMRTRVLRT